MHKPRPPAKGRKGRGRGRGQPGEPETDPRASAATELADETLTELVTLLTPLQQEQGVPLVSLAGTAIGQIVFDDRVFKRIDAQGRGFTDIYSIIQYCFPKVPPKRIQGFMLRDLQLEIFAVVKGAFAQFAAKSRLTEQGLTDAQFQLAGYPLSATQLRQKQGDRPGITLRETLEMIFPSVTVRQLDRLLCSRLHIEEFLFVRTMFDRLDGNGNGWVTAAELGRRLPPSEEAAMADELGPSCRHLVAIPIDTDMFTRGTTGTGPLRIAWPHFLRVYFPSVSDRMLAVYDQAFTPDSLHQVRADRAALEEEEQGRREKIAAEEDKRATRFFQVWATQLLRGESISYNTPPSTASSRREEEAVPVSEVMRLQREREASDRASIESMEGSDRWGVHVEQHRERLRVSDLENRERVAVQEALLVAAMWAKQGEPQAA